MTQSSPSLNAKIELYSDGGYISTKNIGGWGAVIFKDNQPYFTEFGCRKNTSSLEMELQAAVMALEMVKTKLNPFNNIVLHTDSRILIEGLDGKIAKYRQHNWLHQSGRPVESRALWEKFETLTRDLNVTVKWVKGHNGNLGNQMADDLARKAMQIHLNQ